MTSRLHLIIMTAVVAQALSGCAGQSKIVRFDGGEVSQPHAQQMSAICRGGGPVTFNERLIATGEALQGTNTRGSEQIKDYRACMAVHGYRIETAP